MMPEWLKSLVNWCKFVVSRLGWKLKVSLWYNSHANFHGAPTNRVQGSLALEKSPNVRWTVHFLLMQWTFTVWYNFQWSIEQKITSNCGMKWRKKLWEAKCDNKLNGFLIIFAILFEQKKRYLSYIREAYQPQQKR